MIKLAPSILSADFSRLAVHIGLVERAGAEYLHIDVMDGVFVPNITIGPVVVKSIRPMSSMVFDVHLMICSPEKYFRDFADAGADIICFHAEAVENPAAAAEEIRRMGCKPAVAIKPGTSADAVTGILDLLDMVLVMSVEPGYGGQELIPSTLRKAETIAEQICRRGLTTELEMDGGIYLSNISSVLDAGVNVIVAGSAVFGRPDPEAEVLKFKKIFNEYEK